VIIPEQVQGDFVRVVDLVPEADSLREKVAAEANVILEEIEVVGCVI